MLMIFCIYLCWCLRTSQISIFTRLVKSAVALSVCQRQIHANIHSNFGHPNEQTLWGFFLEHFTSQRELCYLKHAFPLTAAARAPHLCLTEPTFSRRVEKELLLTAHGECSSALLVWVCIPNACIPRQPTGSPLDFKYLILLVPRSAGMKGKVVARRYCWHL